MIAATPRIKPVLAMFEPVTLASEISGASRKTAAVIEAAILASRVAMLPREQIQSDLERLRPLVEKTGGEQESQAFSLLVNHVQRYAAQPSA